MPNLRFKWKPTFFLHDNHSLKFAISSHLYPVIRFASALDQIYILYNIICCVWPLLLAPKDSFLSTIHNKWIRDNLIPTPLSLSSHRPVTCQVYRVRQIALDAQNLSPSQCALLVNSHKEKHKNPRVQIAMRGRQFAIKHKESWLAPCAARSRWLRLNGWVIEWGLRSVWLVRHRRVCMCCINIDTVEWRAHE